MMGYLELTLDIACWACVLVIFCTFIIIWVFGKVYISENNLTIRIIETVLIGMALLYSSRLWWRKHIWNDFMQGKGRATG